MADFAVELVGIIGAFTLLLGFFMLTTGRWQRLSPAYQGINLLASLLLLAYGVFKLAYAFIILNIVWAIVALYGLWQSARRSPPEEE